MDFKFGQLSLLP